MSPQVLFKSKGLHFFSLLVLQVVVVAVIVDWDGLQRRKLLAVFAQCKLLRAVDISG
jgi:hypothetical protein